MKKLLISLIVLGLLINWMPTSAEAAAPTVTITPPSGTQTAAFDVTITFSEDVTGFEKGDIGLTNGASVMDLTGSDDSYTATIKSKVTGDITISVGANVATNTGGEGNTAATNQTVSVDLPHSIMIMGPSGDEDRNAAFDITVMFTESVGAFVAGDITLTPSTMATVGTPSGSAPTYTVTITPAANQDGTLSIQIAANAVQDSSSVNYGTASNTVTVDIDNVRPTVSSITGPSTTQNGDFAVTITFNEEVDDFDAGDLTVSGGASAPSSWTTGADGSTSFTGTIDISGVSTGNSNSVGISVGSNVAEDAAGNGNAASASTVDLTVTVDNKKPTPTLGSVTGTKNADFTVSITFDESVSNFAKSDISFSAQSGTAGGTAKSLTGSGMTYSATITPSGTGTLRISVPAGAADDGAGNTSNASAHVDVSVDTEAPTPTITVPMTPQNGAFDATIDFGETVTGFVKADVTVGGTATHTVGALSGGTNGSYTLRITPTTSGTITIDVAANVATDGGSNSNNAATQATVTIDKDPPMPTITAPTTDQKDAFDVTIDFGEDVTGFVVGDLTVAGATKASNWKSIDAGPQTYTITLTPTAAAGTEGTVTIDVNANVAMDAATNNNTAATQASVSIDKKRPTVMITGAPTAEQKSAFDLTITFNEDVTGFAADDLTVTGEATVTTVAAVGTSKTNYTATITPNAAKEGDVTVKVNANAATDEAGNGNIVSAATGNIHIDTIVPTVSVSGFPTAEQNAAYDLTVTFSEVVNGFAVPADLTLGLTREAGATPIAAAALKSGSDGDAVYTVTITPNAAGTEGDVTVTVDANSVQDFALNNNTASTETTSVHVDTIIPTVSVTGFPTIEKNVAYDLTVTFSEEVNGFAVPADLTVTGPVTASLASGSDGDIVYTVTITPNANDEGDVTVRVNASTVQDFARNDNTASPETDVVHVDTIPPTVSVAVTPPTVEAGGYTAAERNAPYLLTVTFSEEVNGFRKKSTIFGYPGTSRSRTS